MEPGSRKRLAEGRVEHGRAISPLDVEAAKRAVAHGEGQRIGRGLQVFGVIA